MDEDREELVDKLANGLIDELAKDRDVPLAQYAVDLRNASSTLLLRANQVDEEIRGQ